MAKVIIAGNALVLKSDITKADLEKVLKYSPKTVKLFNDKEQEKFRIGFGATSNVSPVGVNFNSIDEAGKIFITDTIPLGTPDREAFVADYMLKILSNLEKIEAAVVEELPIIDAKITAMKAKIIVAE